MLESLLELDTNLFLYLNNLGSSTWDKFWLITTNKWSSLPIYFSLAFLLQRKIGWIKTLNIMIFILLLIFFSDQFANILKYGLKRVRPCNLDINARFLANCGRYGYPSAHALNSMGIAIFVGKLLRPYFKKLIYFLIVWSILLGYSRIYVGVHYPIDVLTGFSLGVIFGNLLYYYFNKWSNYVQQINTEAKELDSIYGPRAISFLKYNRPIVLALILVGSILYFRTEIYPETFVYEDTIYEFYFEVLAVSLSLIGLGLRTYAQLLSQRKNLLIVEEEDSLYPNQENNRLRNYYILGTYFLILGPLLWTTHFSFILIASILFWLGMLWLIYCPKCRALQVKTSPLRTDLNNNEKLNYLDFIKTFLIQERREILSIGLLFLFIHAVGEIVHAETSKDFNAYIFIFFALGLINYFFLAPRLKEKTQSI